MARKMSTANDFRQAFLNSLIEVEIPEYGFIVLRSPKYGLQSEQHAELIKIENPREFSVTFLSFLIHSPSITIDEIRLWTDSSIEKSIQAWLSIEVENKWILVKNGDFLRLSKKHTKNIC